ncbi:hypothetical protein ACLI36_35400, partial [Pseudomonas aeruginosa]
MTLPASLFLDELPLAQAIAPPELPGDEPQSLVLAVELAQVAQQLRQRWERLDLNLPDRGTWPLESWRPALHEALYGMLRGASQARPCLFSTSPTPRNKRQSGIPISDGKKKNQR